MSSIYVYGASGHGLVVADIAKACGYKKIIFIDDGDNIYPCFTEINKTIDIPLIFGVGDNIIREKLFKRVEESNLNIITLIHPSAIVSPHVEISRGTVIMPNVVVNTNTNIGKGVILNSSAVIEHENYIDDFVHISPNVSLAGNVTINANSHIGIGSTVIQSIIIGKNSIIGAGSVVLNNIKNNTLAYGNPCRSIRRLDE